MRYAAEAIAELPATGVLAIAPRRRRVAPLSMAAAATGALVIAVIAWWLWPATRSSPAPPANVGTASESKQTAPSVMEPAVAPRLSIVVLPFANLSNDPEQQYFADGVTEDLTTDLSRISHMLVISRNTAFTYRDKPVNAKQIGRELGVRYVLEGSVRRSGNQVRVTAQLIDAATDTHLWADRFDRDTGDLFALQNDITRRIAIALSSELVIAEAARPTEHPDALDYILRGRAASHKVTTPDNYTQAVDLFEHALALDPGSVEAQTSLALALIDRVEQWDDHRAHRRYRTRSRTDRTVVGDIARQHRCASRQRSRAARRGSVRPRHSRIRDGDRIQSQLGGRTILSRGVQDADGVDRGDDPTGGAGNPP
jgi:adenylate cyclase